MDKKETYEELENRVTVLEEKIRLNNETVTSLLNASTDTAFLIEMDGTIVAINEVAARRMGKSIDDLVGRVIYDMVPPDIADLRKRRADTVIQTGEPVIFQDERDGIILDNHVHPVFDSKGDVYRLAIFARDITRQVKTETSLRESIEQELDVLNTMLDSIVIVSKKGIIQYVNPAFSKTYQYTEKEAIGMHASVLIHPDYHHVFERFLKELDETGHFSGETVDLRKDGTTFNTDVNGVNILFQGDVCFLAVVRNITKRKNYEKVVATAAEEWRSTFDAINSVVWVLDEDNRIIRSNKKAEEVFQCPVETIIGKHCWEIVHGTCVPAHECPIVRTRKSRKRESAEIQHNLRWLEVTVDPVFNRDWKHKKSIYTMTDITERKLAETALKESEQLYRAFFLKNVSIILLIEPKTGDIIDANPAACSFYGYPKKILTGMNISDINTLTKEEVAEELRKVESEERNHFNFRHRVASGQIYDVEVYSGPIKIEGRTLLCSIVHDVSERKASEHEREKLIEKLKTALDEIKTLKGIVPICASCKKIRDDQGYWNKLEAYLEKHSDASFTHGICDECSDALYGNEDWYVKMKNKKSGE